jgi:hypothetical protein
MFGLRLLIVGEDVVEVGLQLAAVLFLAVHLLLQVLDGLRELLVVLLQTDDAFVLVGFRGLELGEVGLVELILLLIVLQPLSQLIALQFQLHVLLLRLLLRYLIAFDQTLQSRHAPV